jgi:hemerythrin
MHPTPQFFNWQHEFALGIPDADAEHQRLFEMMDQLYATMLRGDADVRSAHRHLTEYVAYHFAGEEAFLTSIGYPDVDAQRKQHRWFMDELRRLVDGPDPRKTLLALRDRLLEHILGTDNKYARWLESPSSDELDTRFRAAS